MVRTGPKASSQASWVPSETFSIRVGWMMLPSRVPPARMVAPLAVASSIMAMTLSAADEEMSGPQTVVGSMGSPERQRVAASMSRCLTCS